MTANDVQSVTLVVRETIRATPERLFAAWTRPEQLMQWWGPEGVTCTAAEVDLKVGGAYRIANRFPDGTLLWITGNFEVIEPPHRLVYTWSTGMEPGASERVTVRFAAHGDATEVSVTHERIRDAALRDMHEKGWLGCLAGLRRYLASG
jgi:uncharacterized protein YndB with AHSA1/START domain